MFDEKPPSTGVRGRGARGRRALHHFDNDRTIVITSCAHVEFTVRKQHVQQRESERGARVEGFSGDTIGLDENEFARSNYPFLTRARHGRAGAREVSHASRSRPLFVMRKSIRSAPCARSTRCQRA
jgi:hypothetical protein